MERSVGTGLRRLAIALAIPMVPTAAISVFGVGGPAGLLGPVVGPWAGLLVGHHDCTMGTLFPVESIGLGLAALPIFGFAVWGRRRGVQWGMAGMGLLWGLAWCAAALMSFVNAAS